jgi:3-deoxy-D-manno-octulosonate 8-phosphate phosphatase (KDO 8-P phosphatase)
MEKKNNSRKIIAAAKKIKMLVLDVDGVLTDGSIILDNDGNEFKSFHVRDGHGIRMLIKCGIHVAIITGRTSKVVERRALELGVTELYQKCYVKSTPYLNLLEKYNLSDDEVAYIGDDVVDISLLQRVGLPVVVADGSEAAKKYAMMVTKNRGGRGAVREVVDIVLQAIGKWEELMNEYCQA